jgi:tetratricopeptide (TPR) repeat protein
VGERLTLNEGRGPQTPAPAPVAAPPPAVKPIPALPAPAQAAQPAPAAEVRAPQPAPAPPPPPAPSYGDLLKQADTLIANKQYTDAQAALNRAIQTNAAGWQAYNALAKLELYSLNQPAQAFDHYRAAIAKGGAATLRVTPRQRSRMAERLAG